MWKHIEVLNGIVDILLQLIGYGTQHQSFAPDK